MAFVHPGSASTAVRGVAVFWERLRELGWTEGQNLRVEQSWANSRVDRLPGLMADVVSRNPDVIVTYSTPAALAAKQATSTVPVVMASVGDPVGAGLAASLARPGGNLTGLSLEMAEGLGGKWLQLLQEAVPRLAAVAVIANPDNPLVRQLAEDVKAAAPARGVKVRFLEVRRPEALETAFRQAHREAQAALILPDSLMVTHRRRVSDLAASHRLPAMYTLLEFMDVGGLMAYGLDHKVLFGRAAGYVDRILRGTPPADLPIEQPSQYVLVVNLAAARALGLTLPASILLRADEVIR